MRRERRFVPSPSEVVSQCHSEEWSDEESAFWFCSFGTPKPIRHEYGRKADPSLAQDDAGAIIRIATQPLWQKARMRVPR